MNQAAESSVLVPKIWTFHLRPENLSEVAAVLRDENLREIRRWSNREPLPALQAALEVSELASIVYIGERIVGVYGVRVWSLLSGRGSPWAFTTPVCDEYPMMVAKYSRFALTLLQAACPNGLIAWVDARYLEACRWLRWLGFNLGGPFQRGPRGALFYRATLGDLTDV